MIKISNCKFQKIFVKIILCPFFGTSSYRLAFLQKVQTRKLHHVSPDFSDSPPPLLKVKIKLLKN